MSEQKIIRLSWEDYEHAIECLTRKIIEEGYGSNIGLLGLARGGLPMLTSISHQLNNKNVSVMQIKISSDEDDVYSEDNSATFVGEFLRDDIDDYIIIEDILVTGKSLVEAIKHLKRKGKHVLAVYVYSMVDDFENEYFKQNNIHVINYMSNDRKIWIEFPWEKKLID